LALVLAGALYGVTALAGGSGFLAVFIAGLFLGDARTPYKGEIERFSSALAGLAELVVFVALGLTIDISGLSGRVWLDGIVLALMLALLARPLVVLLTLGLARLSWAERAFITWSGLKGAVPILLAAFAVLGGVAGSDHVYGVVFVVVLVSVVGQGEARAACRSSPRTDPRAARPAVGVVGSARRRTPGCTRVRGGRRLARGRTLDPRPPPRRARLGQARDPRRRGNETRRLPRAASRRSRPPPRPPGQTTAAKAPCACAGVQPAPTCAGPCERARVTVLTAGAYDSPRDGRYARE
jgi:Sodium/hydrogen exchanger family